MLMQSGVPGSFLNNCQNFKFENICVMDFIFLYINLTFILLHDTRTIRHVHCHKTNDKAMTLGGHGFDPRRLVLKTYKSITSGYC